ncbi:hypothetical protein [Glycomyces buryatensis]|uniref:Uncharacterized protein n=1 Tax=Glycomyces buryatensis TaxID=2570927 RepID=A0A4S8QAY1_9ACTN|nr:hypothetical protein [Glycomyces buryatensis]THV40671.1 hypothetical protein FAB82_15555 [Glycomyces buryatensis]
MPRSVPGSSSGPGALVLYIQTGDRNARISYRELAEPERLAYRDTVNRVFDAALSQYFGEHPSREEVDDLTERVAARHPQYGGGVKRVLRALVEGGRRGEISPRQIITAQHLVIREIAKLHPDFRKAADRIVAEASASRLPGGSEPDMATLAAAYPAESAAANDPEVLRLRAALEAEQRKTAEMRESLLDAEFSGTDSNAVATVTLGLDGSMRDLELLRGAERMGGRSIAVCVLRAWVVAEKQRWNRAKELGKHDSFPKPGSGASKGDTFLCEAYSSTRLCRATVDRYGRLRGVTFMRTDLLGDDGRHGLAAEIREAIDGAQVELKTTL